MRRNHEIKVRFDDEEYKDLNEKVLKSGLSREKYIRSLIKKMTFKELPPVEYYKLINECNAVGNNLNQLTKLAHIYKSINENKCIEILNKLERVIEKVESEIRGN